MKKFSWVTILWTLFLRFATSTSSKKTGTASTEESLSKSFRKELFVKVPSSSTDKWLPVGSYTDILQSKWLQPLPTLLRQDCQILVLFYAAEEDKDEQTQIKQLFDLKFHATFEIQMSHEKAIEDFLTGFPEFHSFLVVAKKVRTVDDSLSCRFNLFFPENLSTKELEQMIKTKMKVKILTNSKIWIILRDTVFIPSINHDNTIMPLWTMKLGDVKSLQDPAKLKKKSSASLDSSVPSLPFGAYLPSTMLLDILPLFDDTWSVGNSLIMSMVHPKFDHTNSFYKTSFYILVSLDEFESKFGNPWGQFLHRSINYVKGRTEPMQSPFIIGFHALSISSRYALLTLLSLEPLPSDMINEIPESLSTGLKGLPHNQNPKNMKSSKKSQQVSPNHSIRLGLEVPTGALLAVLLPELNVLDELQSSFRNLKIANTKLQNETRNSANEVRQLTKEETETIEICKNLLDKLSRIPGISNNAESCKRLTTVVEKLEIIEQKAYGCKENESGLRVDKNRNQNLWSFFTQNGSLNNFKWHLLAQVSSLHDLRIVLSGNIPGCKLGSNIHKKETFAADLISNMHNLPNPFSPAELESFIDQSRKSNFVTEYDLSLATITLVFKEFFDKNILSFDENPIDADSLSFVLLQYTPKCRIIVVFAENFDVLVKLKISKGLENIVAKIDKDIAKLEKSDRKLKCASQNLNTIESTALMASGVIALHFLEKSRYWKLVIESFSENPLFERNYEFKDSNELSGYEKILADLMIDVHPATRIRNTPIVFSFANFSTADRQSTAFVLYYGNISLISEAIFLWKFAIFIRLRQVASLNEIDCVQLVYIPGDQATTLIQYFYHVPSLVDLDFLETIKQYMNSNRKVLTRSARKWERQFSKKM